jgi:hypothetical protein
MPTPTQEILDLLIAIEKEMSRLYFDFAMLFHNQTDHHSFWQNIAMEEVEHASFLESESQIISVIAELQFSPFVKKQKLDEVYSEIREKRAEFTRAPFNHNQAIKTALEIEIGYNENLLRHAIKSEFLQVRKILETLGSMNERHIELLKQQRLASKQKA